MVHESQTLIQSLLPQSLDAEVHQVANNALEMLQLARDALDEGSEECYQQQVLRYPHCFSGVVDVQCCVLVRACIVCSEVSDGSYQPRPQRVDIGHQLARACRQAKLATPGKLYLDIDTTLMRHLLQNAQVDQLLSQTQP